MTQNSLEREAKFVVIKHALKDMNNNIAGVRFRGGYAVVQKGCKTYLHLKSLPLIKGQPEYPLIFLRQLSFITNAKQVDYIYGPLVYRAYIEALHLEIDKEVSEEIEKQETVHVEVKNGCAYRTSKGDLCGHEAAKGSPSKYCKIHLLDDPKLVEVGIVIPTRLTKEEKKKYRSAVASKLEKLPG